LFLLATQAEAEAVTERLRMNFTASDWAVVVGSGAGDYGMYRVAVVPVASGPDSGNETRD
jgi:phosphoserine phosphatase